VVVRETGRGRRVRRDRERGELPGQLGFGSPEDLDGGRVEPEEAALVVEEGEPVADDVDERGHHRGGVRG
jgi:hypothetical protein